MHCKRFSTSDSLWQQGTGRFATTGWVLGLGLSLILATDPVSAEPGTAPAVGADTATTSAVTPPDYGCGKPYKIPFDLASRDQVGADGFAWQTFLGLTLSNPQPNWTTWDCTVDLINCGQDQAPANGSCTDNKFMPETCKSIKGYESLQVIDQVGKIDAAVLEAEAKGLSGSPVIAANGTFLRYQILISPQTSSWIQGQQIQQASALDDLQKFNRSVRFLCSNPLVAGSNTGSTLLKLAWMDGKGMDPSTYYSQEMLVFTPQWRSSTGQATCEKATMLLVGVHLIRKTVNQPAWVWSTFEHARNAPDCTAPPGDGNAQGGQGPSTACPAKVSNGWNFYAKSCQKDGKDGPCQSCNVGPLTNGGGHSCINPTDQAAYKAASMTYASSLEAWKKAGSIGTAPEAPSKPPNWCLDLPPATIAGASRLCRQMAPQHYYPGTASWDETPPNKACQPKNSVWSHYQLISTQFLQDDMSEGGACPNVQEKIWRDDASLGFPIVNHAAIAPQLEVLTGKDGTPRSFLANTALESYERSNCIGCHSKSTVHETIGGRPAYLPKSSHTPTSPGTDFMYFIGLEVDAFEAAPAAPAAAPTAASSAADSSGER